MRVCIFPGVCVCVKVHLSMCICVFVFVFVCGPTWCSAPLGCSSRGLAICTIGGGKRVRMKGGDPGGEGRMQAQGAGKEREKSRGQEGGGLRARAQE